MAELTIGQLIKIILGALVVAVVVFAVYTFFEENIYDFFKNMLGADVWRVVI